MADLFKALGFVALVILATMGVGAALVLRSLIRANRVAPGRRSAAPLSWLVSLRLAARLHRRLRRAVGVSGFAVGTLAPSAVPLRDVADELVQRAVSLDDWLVATLGLHPEARRYRLTHLTAEVREVEGAAARLQQLCSDWRRCLDQAAEATAMPIPDLHERLDAVEAALRELPPSPSLAPTVPTPAPAPARAVARPRR